MLSKLAETAGEVLANLAIFTIALALSTGMTCAPKVSCDQPRDQAAEAGTP